MARAKGWRAALAAGLLPLLASCWWLESAPGPGEWSLRSGTIGDFQPQHVATLNETDGPGSLVMECGQGAIAMRVRTDRDLVMGDAIRVPVRYRLDSRPPAALSAWTSGEVVWFRDPAASASGDDPLMAGIAGAQALTLRIDWSDADRQILRFDTSRTAPAVEWLRSQCAEARARRGG
jgi:hypothetical protein